MRWKIELFAAHGLRIIQIIYASSISEAAKIYCEESNDTLELRSWVLDYDHLTFSNKNGRAVVISREKLD